MTGTSKQKMNKTLRLFLFKDKTLGQADTNANSVWDHLRLEYSKKRAV